MDSLLCLHWFRLLFLNYPLMDTLHFRVNVIQKTFTKYIYNIKSIPLTTAMQSKRNATVFILISSNVNRFLK